MKITKKIKIPKKYWEKGKSKFLSHRPELQNNPNFSVSDKFKEEQIKTIAANRKRREEKYGSN